MLQLCSKPCKIKIMTLTEEENMELIYSFISLMFLTEIVFLKNFCVLHIYPGSKKWCYTIFNCFTNKTTLQFRMRWNRKHIKSTHFCRGLSFWLKWLNNTHDHCLMYVLSYFSMHRSLSSFIIHVILFGTVSVNVH